MYVLIHTHKLKYDNIDIYTVCVYIYIYIYTHTHTHTHTCYQNVIIYLISSNGKEHWKYCVISLLVIFLVNYPFKNEWTKVSGLQVKFGYIVFRSSMSKAADLRPVLWIKKNETRVLKLDWDWPVLLRIKTGNNPKIMDDRYRYTRWSEFVQERKYEKKDISGVIMCSLYRTTQGWSSVHVEREMKR